MSEPQETGSERNEGLAEVISATKWEHDDHAFSPRGEPSLDDYADLDDGGEHYCHDHGYMPERDWCPLCEIAFELREEVDDALGVEPADVEVVQR